MAKAYIVAIGDELLNGRTLDYNSYWIAKRLTSLGFDVKRIVTVPDDINSIAEVIKDAITKGFEIIVTTGGLGPTPGDVTLEAVALALNRDLVLDARALEMVKSRYQQLYEMGFVSSPEVTPDREKMARIPRGATPYYNPIGVAPGILLQLNENRFIISLPSVPSEMMYLLEQIIPTISRIAKRYVIRTREETIKARDESKLASIFRYIMDSIPGVFIKSYPVGFGRELFMRVIITAKGEKEEEAEDKLSRAIQMLRNLAQKEGDNL